MKNIKKVFDGTDITGLVPGVKGQRAFPTSEAPSPDPFLLLDHIGPQHLGTRWQLDGRGHDHPHRGFETLTFMFEGKMDHRDSLGNQVELRNGSIQKMNAGAGIIHGGDMHADPETGIFHEIQLWVNNPRNLKLSRPEIVNVSQENVPVIESNGVKTRVVAGKLNGLQGAFSTLAPTQIAHISSVAGGAVTLSNFQNDADVHVYVMEGLLSIGGTDVQAFRMAQLSASGSHFVVDLSAGSQALILAGVPLKQSVVFGGPFVMSSRQEIDKAYVDFQDGAFGKIETP